MLSHSVALAGAAGLGARALLFSVGVWVFPLCGLLLQQCSSAVLVGSKCSSWIFTLENSWCVNMKILYMYIYICKRFIRLRERPSSKCFSLPFCGHPALCLLGMLGSPKSSLLWSSDLGALWTSARLECSSAWFLLVYKHMYPTCLLTQMLPNMERASKRQKLWSQKREE